MVAVPIRAGPRGGLARGGCGAFARRYATIVHLAAGVSQQIIVSFLVLYRTSSVGLHTAKN